MIPFKQFITETFIDPDTGKPSERSNWLTSRQEAKWNKNNTTQIGENDTHTFHKIDKGDTSSSEYPDEAGSKSTVYYAKRKAGGHIDATINGHEKDGALHIGSMATKVGGTAKMSDMIHHLVTHHGMIVGAKHFSPAGHGTLKKVGGMVGVGLKYFKGHKEVEGDTPDQRETDAHGATYMVVHKKE